MGAFFRFIRFIANLIFGPPAPPPRPPARSYYGFRWQPGNGQPSTLIPNAMVRIEDDATGLFIVLQERRFELLRLGAGPGAPVFDYPLSPFMPAGGVPAPALVALINQLRANLPQEETWNITQQQQVDATGFFRYCAWCLNLIYQTAAGQALLDELRNGPKRIIVTPGYGFNNAFAGGLPMNVVADTLLAFDRNQSPLNRAAIRDAIDPQGVGLPRYNQLAADLNAMPLYSVFVDEADFVANFLNTNYLYLGAPITGQQLMTWLADRREDRDPAFEAWLLTDTLVQRVNLRRFLFLAMIIKLYPNSAAQAGAETLVQWVTLNLNENQVGDADWRPPAIGLTHELMHALYNARGRAPGYDNNTFTITAAELQASGIIPFDGNLVSENQVRAQWGGVNNPAPDPTNTGATPRRTIYTAPGIGQTAVQLREASRENRI